ncbi:CHU large protein; uncharacterized [Flavobacteriales bacterium ALC-1]|nr:CHU large protein; uncharacterized [Flavobacteriales bacterium ALC-1]
MKKITLALLVMLAFCWQSNAQATYYSFSETTGNTFASISATGTALPLTDDSKALVDIGFTFPYSLIDYTQVSVSSNGYMRMGDVVASNAFNTLAGTGIYLDLIGPFWEDLNPGDGGAIYHQTDGTAPNRTFTLEYNAVPRYNGAATVTVQAVLYETTGNIEFKYGTTGTGFASASIGMTMSPGGTDNYISVTPGTPATSSSTTPNDALTDSPADGVNYLFTYTPPSCLPPSGLSASPTSTTDVDITWTAGGSETDWTYEYGVSPYAQGGGGTSGTVMTTPSLSLTGLTVGETYDIYIQANCGAPNGDSTYMTVQWTQPNVGDVCAVAISATVEADCSTATPVSLDFDTGGTETLTSCDGFGNNGYWVEVTTPVNGSMNINLGGTATGVGVAIYDACDGTEVFCNNNTLGATTELTGFAASTAYYFYFWQDTAGGVAEVCFEEISCVFPSGLGVNVNSTTTADISWDENNTPAATAWEYVVQAPGTGLPAGAGTATTSNPTSLTSLTVDTSYEFYVRTDCGGAFSDWSGPFVWYQALPPANDECDNAVALTVNSDFSCGSVTAGTTVAATASAQADDVTGTPDNDVWFSFVASATDHRVSLTNVTAIVGTATDMGMGVYDGTGGCAGLVFFDDSDPNTLNLTGLTVSTTYYVRVYGWSSTTSAQTNFDICVGTPPAPPVNDDIATAIAITVDESFCDGTNTNGTNESATDSGEGAGSCFNAAADDDVWFTFTVPAGTATVDVSTDFTGGTLVDSEIAVYSGTSGSLVELDCSQDDGTTTLSNGFSWNSLITDLAVTVGETYYVQVAGYNTNVGTFCLDVSTNQVLSTTDLENEAAFTYYPNPVKNTLNLNAQNTIEQVAMYNMLGQEVLRATPNTIDSELDMSSLQTGTYFVKVTIANVTKTVRVIKQ